VFAVYASKIDPEDPLAGLSSDERPEPEAPEGWATVTVKAASLNHHDLWSLRGVGLSADVDVSVSMATVSAVRHQSNSRTARLRNRVRA